MVLAIEAAIGGGSVAVLSGGTVLGKWCGEGSTARSEQLLQVISNLLVETAIEKNALTRIAVSNGPGSYTGIRIGLATALGLSRALNIPLTGISALRAMALYGSEPQKIVVVPLGRSGYCWQSFSTNADRSNSEMLGSGNMDALLEYLISFPEVPVIAHAATFTQITQSDRLNSRSGPIVNFGCDVAVAVGSVADSIDDGLLPHYAMEAYVSGKSPEKHGS